MLVLGLLFWYNMHNNIMHRRRTWLFHWAAKLKGANQAIQKVGERYYLYDVRYGYDRGKAAFESRFEDICRTS